MTVDLLSIVIRHHRNPRWAHDEICFQLKFPSGEMVETHILVSKGYGKQWLKVLLPKYKYEEQDD